MLAGDGVSRSRCVEEGQLVKPVQLHKPLNAQFAQSFREKKKESTLVLTSGILKQVR